MIVWAIKRSDGKWWAGQGANSWKRELCSASLLKECYLKSSINQASYIAEMTGNTIKPVKIEIKEIGDE